MAKTIATNILKEYIPVNRKDINRPGTRMNPTSVTVHNTDNTRKGAGAKANSRFLREVGFYTHGGKVIKCSWHFTVDDTYVIQQLPLNEVAYHAGKDANGSSLAIEICMNSDNDQDTANRRAAGLVAGLLKAFNWKIDAVKQHHDWTKKNCPSLLRQGVQWSTFLAMVSEAVKSGGPLVVIDPAETKANNGEWLAAPIVEDFDIEHKPLSAAIENSLIP